MQRHLGTLWALVTDSGLGRLVKLTRSPSGMSQIVERESRARHSPSRDLASDASGRDFNAAGPVSHAKKPRTDPHEAAETEFVREWVARLEKMHASERIDRLMLVADPRTLGRLRAEMSASLRSAVVREEALDLVKLVPKDLEQRLRDLAGWNR